ncbi:hypothetical protein AKJ16_DCAP25492 [Drosera capensis]
MIMANEEPETTSHALGACSYVSEAVFDENIPVEPLTDESDFRLWWFNIMDRLSKEEVARLVSVL